VIECDRFDSLECRGCGAPRLRFGAFKTTSASPCGLVRACFALWLSVFVVLCCSVPGTLADEGTAGAAVATWSACQRTAKSFIVAVFAAWNRCRHIMQLLLPPTACFALCPAFSCRGKCRSFIKRIALLRAIDSLSALLVVDRIAAATLGA
jgi:hypothetical protein